MSIKVSIGNNVRREAFLKENLQKLVDMFNAMDVENKEISKYPTHQGLDTLLFFLIRDCTIYGRHVFETRKDEIGNEYDNIIRYKHKTDETAPSVCFYTDGSYFNTTVEIATVTENYLYALQEIDYLLKFEDNK